MSAEGDSPYWEEMVGDNWPQISPADWNAMAGTARDGASSIDVSAAPQARAAFDRAVPSSIGLQVVKDRMQTEQYDPQTFAAVLNTMASGFDAIAGIVRNARNRILDVYDNTLALVQADQQTNHGDDVASIIATAAGTIAEIAGEAADEINPTMLPQFSEIAELLGIPGPWAVTPTGAGGSGSPPGAPGRSPFSPYSPFRQPGLLPSDGGPGMSGGTNNPWVTTLRDLGLLPNTPGDLTTGEPIPSWIPFNSLMPPGAVIPGALSPGLMMPVSPPSTSDSGLGIPVVPLTGNGYSDSAFGAQQLPSSMNSAAGTPGATGGDMGSGTSGFDGQSVNDQSFNGQGVDGQTGGGQLSTSDTPAAGTSMGNDPTAGNPGGSLLGNNPFSGQSSSMGLVGGYGGTDGSMGNDSADGGDPGSPWMPPPMGAGAVGGMAGPADDMSPHMSAVTPVTVSAPEPSLAPASAPIDMSNPPTPVGTPPPVPPAAQAVVDRTPPPPVREAIAAAVAAAAEPSFVVGERVNGDLVLARLILGAIVAATDAVGVLWAVAVLRGPGGITLFVTSNEGRGWLPAGLFLPAEASIPWVWNTEDADHAWEDLADPARILVEFAMVWGRRFGARLSAVVSSAAVDPGLRTTLPEVTMEGLVGPNDELNLGAPGPGRVDRLTVVASPEMVAGIDTVADVAIRGRCVELARDAESRVTAAIKPATAEVSQVRALRERILGAIGALEPVADDWFDELRDADDLLGAGLVTRRVDPSHVALGELQIDPAAAALRWLVFERRCDELVLLLAGDASRQTLRDVVYAHGQVVGHPLFPSGPATAATKPSRPTVIAPSGT